MRFISVFYLPAEDESRDICKQRKSRHQPEGFYTVVLFPEADGDKGSSHDSDDKIKGVSSLVLRQLGEFIRLSMFGASVERGGRV